MARKKHLPQGFQQGHVQAVGQTADRANFDDDYTLLFWIGRDIGAYLGSSPEHFPKRWLLSV